MSTVENKKREALQKVHGALIDLRKTGVMVTVVTLFPEGNAVITIVGTEVVDGEIVFKKSERST